MNGDHTTRRRLLAATGTAATGALAGCTGSIDGLGSSGGDSDDEQTTTAPAAGDDAGTEIGMVYALGGLGDRSFNDAANRGVKRARLDYDVDYTNHEPASKSEFAKIHRRLATSESPDYDLVCCIGFLQSDAVSTVAPNHPDQQFMLVDSVVDADNVANYVFKEHTGSFQVGNLVGRLTTRDISLGTGATRPDETTVGFVGGVDMPLIHKFQAGFQAGVAHANGDVEVLTDYVGNFTDAEAGYDIAEGMYDDGADIVYHAAGGAGLGVFQAAQQNERYAVGVDSDQSRSNPRYADVILASMVKRVNVAVYDAVEAVVNGELSTGGVTALGLDQNGVGVVYGTSLEPAIPDDVREALVESRNAIAAGDIEVPSELPRTGDSG